MTGTKVLRILKAKGLASEIPEDLYHMIKKAVSIRKHLERNRKVVIKLSIWIVGERRVLPICNCAQYDTGPLWTSFCRSYFIIDMIGLGLRDLQFRFVCCLFICLSQTIAFAKIIDIPDLSFHPRIVTRNSVSF